MNDDRTRRRLFEARSTRNSLPRNSDVEKERRWFEERDSLRSYEPDYHARGETDSYSWSSGGRGSRSASPASRRRSLSRENSGGESSEGNSGESSMRGNSRDRSTSMRGGSTSGRRGNSGNGSSKESSSSMREGFRSRREGSRESEMLPRQRGTSRSPVRNHMTTTNTRNSMRPQRGTPETTWRPISSHNVSSHCRGDSYHHRPSCQCNSCEERRHYHTDNLTHTHRDTISATMGGRTDRQVHTHRDRFSYMHPVDYHHHDRERMRNLDGYNEWARGQREGDWSISDRDLRRQRW